MPFWHPEVIQGVSTLGMHKSRVLFHCSNKRPLLTGLRHITTDYMRTNARIQLPSGEINTCSVHCYSGVCLRWSPAVRDVVPRLRQSAAGLRVVKLSPACLSGLSWSGAVWFGRCTKNLWSCFQCHNLTSALASWGPVTPGSVLYNSSNYTTIASFFCWPSSVAKSAAGFLDIETASPLLNWSWN